MLLFLFGGVARLFYTLAFLIDFAFFIEVHVAIADTFTVSVAISSINVTDDATVDTISVALDDYTLALSFVVFNVLIVVVGGVVGVDNSFPITVTVAVVAFAVTVTLTNVVVDVVFFCWS